MIVNGIATKVLLGPDFNDHIWSRLMAEKMISFFFSWIESAWENVIAWSNLRESKCWTFDDNLCIRKTTRYSMKMNVCGTIKGCDKIEDIHIHYTTPKQAVQTHVFCKVLRRWKFKWKRLEPSFHIEAKMTSNLHRENSNIENIGKMCEHGGGWRWAYTKHQGVLTRSIGLLNVDDDYFTMWRRARAANVQKKENNENHARYRARGSAMEYSGNKFPKVLCGTHYV